VDDKERTVKETELGCALSVALLDETEVGFKNAYIHTDKTPQPYHVFLLLRSRDGDRF